MLSKAMQRYDLGSLTRQIQTIVGALGLGQVVSQFGRYAVSQVAKLLPSVGTVAGGVINGAVAKCYYDSARFDDFGTELSRETRNDSRPERLQKRINRPYFYKTRSKAFIRPIFEKRTAILKTRALMLSFFVILMGR